MVKTISRFQRLFDLERLEHSVKTAFAETVHGAHTFKTFEEIIESGSLVDVEE